jgi:COP9 signalosome complex subunit 6
MVLTDDKVFPKYDVLGWYSNVSDIQDSDMLIHKALTDTNESTVYLLLNPTINHAQKDLPFAIFESGGYVYS